MKPLNLAMGFLSIIILGFIVLGITSEPVSPVDPVAPPIAEKRESQVIVPATLSPESLERIEKGAAETQKILNEILAELVKLNQKEFPVPPPPQKPENAHTPTPVNLTPPQEMVASEPPPDTLKADPAPPIKTLPETQEIPEVQKDFTKPAPELPAVSGSDDPPELVDVFHVITRGETVHHFVLRYMVDDFVRNNGLNSNYQLEVGQVVVLKIPLEMVKNDTYMQSYQIIERLTQDQKTQYWLIKRGPS